MLVRVLIAARDPGLRRRLGGLIEREGVEVRASVALPALAELSKLGEGAACDLVVVDRVSLGDPAPKGVSALRSLAERPEVVVVQEVDSAVDRSELLIAGARDVLPRDLPDALLRPVFRELLARIRRTAELRLEKQLRVPPATPHDASMPSPLMRGILQQAHQVADASTSVLLLGESGVGKEWLARSIHAAGHRRGRPFVPVHCAALPESLIESELFGHERGAFTGATRAHRGHFELAHGGTLFLDEVGDIPLRVQTKLLRVLQERSVQRLGAEASFPVDVRVISATHKDLRRAMAEGTFRDDLWYRLAVVELEVPPLRQRPEDLPALIEHFLAHHARALGREVPDLHPGAEEALRRHSWPGNVRELMNTLERALLFCVNSEILPEHLPPAVRAGPGTEPLTPPLRAAAHGAAAPVEDALAIASAGGSTPTLGDVRRRALEGVDRGFLEGLLRLTGGSAAETAMRAGVPIRSLYELLRRHGIDKKQFKRVPSASSAGRRPSGRDDQDVN